MTVVVVGLNHRSVPLSLLERVTVDDSRLPKALHDVVSRDHVSEAVVLSTCNRTEVYFVAEKFHPAFGDLRTFFSELAFVPPEELVDHLYVHDADDCAGDDESWTELPLRSSVARHESHTESNSRFSDSAPGDSLRCASGSNQGCRFDGGVVDEGSSTVGRSRLS